MKRIVNRLAGALIAIVCLFITVTCRRKQLEDSRPALRAKGTRYVLAGLHAHQAAMVFFNDEARLAAMVSRSTDGDLLVPSLRARRVVPVRGSSTRKGRDKGGARALVTLIKLVREGLVGLITVDGPRGPRGSVQPGIAALARKSESLIVPTAIVPTRRLILRGTWDRMQIPLPFSRLDYAFGAPLDPSTFNTDEDIQHALAAAITALEEKYDPAEFRVAHGAPRKSA
ncbi:MAG: DUF374 domain-containing protein [Myxococcota bacterium]